MIGPSATKLSGLRRSEDCDPNGGGFVGKLAEKFSGAAVAVARRTLAGSGAQ